MNKEKANIVIELMNEIKYYEEIITYLETGKDFVTISKAYNPIRPRPKTYKIDNKLVNIIIDYYNKEKEKLEKELENL